jgi:hypothetical protein
MLGATIETGSLTAGGIIAGLLNGVAVCLEGLRDRKRQTKPERICRLAFSRAQRLFWLAFW